MGWDAGDISNRVFNKLDRGIKDYVIKKTACWGMAASMSYAWSCYVERRPSGMISPLPWLNSTRSF